MFIDFELIWRFYKRKYTTDGNTEKHKHKTAFKNVTGNRPIELFLGIGLDPILLNF